jgi:DNA repair exonuclease SbcCD nuclease subunit
MAKYAILNDTHFGTRKTSEIIIEEQRKFFENIFFPYCKKHKIKKIFHAGDYWTDRYALSVKSMYVSRKMFLEKIRDEGMTMEIIPGNHDLGYKNNSTLNSLKESFGYFQPHVIIHSNPTECVYEDGMKVLWLPWVNSENLSKSLEAIDKTDAPILIGHLALSGFEFFKGQEATELEEEHITQKHLSKFKAVWTGHYHHKSSRDNIIYLGSQYQMSWNDFGSRKFFHVVNTKNPLKLTAVENPRSLYEHYYYDDKTNLDEILSFDAKTLKEKFVKVFILHKSNPHLFESFIEKLNSFSEAYEIRVMPSQIVQSDDSSIGIENIISSGIMKRNTIDLVNEFINEHANPEVYNQDVLKRIAQQLLIESETLMPTRSSSEFIE